MKTIAICNHKGGVGKTALSMAIAEGLHRKGKRTLLVDLDQQMNARDAADWSMICAYLRLDDEGRKRVIEEIEYQTSRMMKEREEERRAWLSKDI